MPANRRGRSADGSTAAAADGPAGPAGPAPGRPGPPARSGPPPRDDVDRLVQAWRRERPDLDTSPLEVLSRVTRLARHLDRARRQVFAEHDLEPSEFDVLSALRRAGPPYELSPGVLLAQTLVTSGTMTNRIDRLAAKGLVQRRPEPLDRRGVRVRLTAEGRERVDGALARLLDHERRLLAGLRRSDRDRLADLLRTLVIPFDEQI